MASPTRQIELDSLRGIAVLLVVFDHFGISRVWNGFPWGIIGVKFLFLFSGYFATRELLKSAHPSTLDAAKLLLGRLLRILPVGIAVLVAGRLLGVEGAESGIPFSLLFSGNLQVLRTGEWVGAFSHLWSLALQIQFYLIWPLLLIAVGSRKWPALFSGCFLGAWLYRTLCLATGAPDEMRWMHLPGSIDAFAAGALVAWIEVRRPAWSGWTRGHRWGLTGMSGLLLAAGYGLRSGGFPPPIQALMETCECLFAFGLMALVRWDALPFARALRAPSLPWIGRISFGLYAFHPVVENCLRHRDLAQPIENVPWLFESLLLGLSLAAGWACLVLIERPLARLRRLDWLKGALERGAPRILRLPRGACTAAIVAFLAIPILIGQRPPATAGMPTMVESGDVDPIGAPESENSTESMPEDLQPPEPDGSPDSSGDDLSGHA
jgi:peptidoglycan/LPS O-acetylase OafA/YrhL